jgi:hypothetical protein
LAGFPEVAGLVVEGPPAGALGVVDSLEFVVSVMVFGSAVLGIRCNS